MLLTCFSNRTSLKGQRDSLSRADPIRRFKVVLSNLGLSTDLKPTPYPPKSRMRTPNAPESCRGGYAKQFGVGIPRRAGINNPDLQRSSIYS